MKTGLVLEGGGLRGIFTAGVLDVLMEEGIEFDGAIGVSAGAAFGCNYKSKQPRRAIHYNMRFAKDPRYSGVRSFLSTGDLFGAQFCYHEIPEKLYPFDWETFRQNPMEFYLVCTDVETGKPVYHLCDNDDDWEMLEWFRASGSMPLVSRVVEIGDHKLLDGGIADSIPLRFMEEQGYERNLVILTRAADYRKQANPMMPLISRALRKYPAAVQAIADRHIDYNRTLAYVRQREAEKCAFVIRPEKEPDIGRIEHDRNKIRAVYKEGRRTARRLLPKIRRFLAEAKAEERIIGPADTVEKKGPVPAEAPAAGKASVPAEAVALQAADSVSVETPAPKGVETAPAEAPAYVEAPAPAKTPAREESAVPAETPVFTEVPVPEEPAAPAEAPAPAEIPVFSEVPALEGTAAPAEAPAPAEIPAFTEVPAPEEPVAPAEAPAFTGVPAPKEPAVPAETLEFKEVPTPEEPAVPAETLEFKEVPTPEEPAVPAETPVFKEVPTPKSADSAYTAAEKGPASAAAPAAEEVFAPAEVPVPEEPAVPAEAPASAERPAPAEIAAPAAIPVSKAVDHADAAEEKGPMPAEGPVAAEVPAPAKVPAPAVVSAPAEAPTPVGALAQKAAELADAAKRKGLPKLKLPKLFKKKTSHAAKPAEKAEVKTESADVKSGAPGGEAVAPEALSPAAAALVQPVVSPEIFTRGRKRRKPWKTSSMKALKQRCEQGTVYGTDV